MNYNQLMQKPGKMIEPKVYYFIDGEKHEILHDDIKLAKPFFNAKLIGTVMKGLELELNVKLPDVEVFFENTVSYLDNKDSKIYGPYYLKEEPTYNADSKTYSHTLYDKFIKSMVEYIPIKIEYPTTVYNFFKQLCSECGFNTDIQKLPNGNRPIISDVYSGINYTYRDIFEDIGQATGTLFIVDVDTIKKCDLTTDEIIINDDILKNSNISLGEHFGPINSIILSRSGDSDYIYKRDETLNEWNEFKISDNQLMNDNNRSDYLDELYNALHGIEYDIFDLELIGFGGFNPLQNIKIQTDDNEYFSFVFNNEEEYTQGYKEVIYTELPEELKPDYTVSDTTDRRINQTYIIVDKQNQKIESLASEVSQYDEKISQVEQTVDEISQKVNEVVDLEREITTHSMLHIPDAKEGPLLNLTIDGELSYIYPEDTLYPSNDLYPLASEFILVVDKTEKMSDEAVQIKLPFDYLGKQDKFIAENGTCRIEKSDGTTVDLGALEIPLFDGENYIHVKDYTERTGSIYAKYVIKNNYTDYFATKVELNTSITQTNEKIESEVSHVETLLGEQVEDLNSKITQTAEDINLEVSKKIGEDEIIASLNVAVENDLGIIELKGNHVTVDSDNFKLDKEGNITANNADLSNVNINNGDINLTDNGQEGGSSVFLNSFVKSLNSNTEINSFYYKRTTNYNNVDYIYENNALNGVRQVINNDNSQLMAYGLYIRNSLYEATGSASGVIPSEIYVTNYDTGSSTTMTANGVTTPKLTQTSLAEQKKNFEKFNGALKIIDDIDLYKYNLKAENNQKKHIGFVIGDKFKYSSEITSVDDNGKETGVDLYSMTSLCLQAIKEQKEIINNQQSTIEELTKRIEILERNGVNG